MLIFCSVVGEEEPRKRQESIEIDEGLLLGIANNDMESLEKFYRLTEKAVYSYILSILKNHEDAQDVMQDTYLKIRSAAHFYKPQGKPLAWVFTIAKNLCLMKLRTRRNHAETDFSDVENNAEFSYVSDSCDQIVLRAALAILDENESQIILLYAVSGLKHREIAGNLSIPLSTVLSKYHRGLKKLRRYLADKEELL